MKKDNKEEKKVSNNNSSVAKNKLKAADEVSEFTENIINIVREPLLALKKEIRVVIAKRLCTNEKQN